MDHNAGVNLPQARTKDGSLRYKLVFPKQAAAWVAKPIKSHKNKSYMHEMVDRVVECCNGNIELEESTIVPIPKNIATTPRPEKNAVVAAHRSRFSITK